MPNKR